MVPALADALFWNEARVATGQSHEVLSSFRQVTAASDRKFGLIVGAVLALAALTPALHGRPIRLWLLVPGLALLVLGALAPRLLGPANRVWFRFGLLLGRITNPIVMGVLFYAVLAPIGWFLRWRGMDILQLRHDAKATTYWIPRVDGPNRPSLKNQF